MSGEPVKVLDPDLLLEASRVMNAAGPEYAHATRLVSDWAVANLTKAEPQTRAAIVGDAAALRLRAPGQYDDALKFLQEIETPRCPDPDGRLHVLRALANGQKYTDLKQKGATSAEDLGNLLRQIREDLAIAFQRDKTAKHDNRVYWHPPTTAEGEVAENDLHRAYLDDVELQKLVDASDQGGTSANQPTRYDEPINARTPQERNMGRPYTSSDVAWEYFMRGAELDRRFTPKDNARARELFEKAIDLDPQFARAYAGLAATHRQDWSGRWSQDPESSGYMAYRIAQKAVELARSELEPKPSLPNALEQMGWVLLYRKELDEARRAAEEAVQCNPNYADGYALWSQVLVYLGWPQESLDKLQDAMNLSAIIPYSYDYIRGQAYYVLGVLTSAEDPEVSRQHFKQAEINFREALGKNDNYRPARSYLVAVLSELGRQDEAVNEMNISLEKGEPLAKNLKSGNQQLAEQQIRANSPYENQEITNRLWNALLAAAR